MGPSPTAKRVFERGGHLGSGQNRGSTTKAGSRNRFCVPLLSEERDARLCAESTFRGGCTFSPGSIFALFVRRRSSFLRWYRRRLIATRSYMVQGCETWGVTPHRCTSPDMLRVASHSDIQIKLDFYAVFSIINSL